MMRVGLITECTNLHSVRSPVLGCCLGEGKSCVCLVCNKLRMEIKLFSGYIVATPPIGQRPPNQAFLRAASAHVLVERFARRRVRRSATSIPPHAAEPKNGFSPTHGTPSHSWFGWRLPAKPLTSIVVRQTHYRKWSEGGGEQAHTVAGTTFFRSRGGDHATCSKGSYRPCKKRYIGVCSRQNEGRSDVVTGPTRDATAPVSPRQTGSAWFREKNGRQIRCHGFPSELLLHPSRRLCAHV